MTLFVWLNSGTYVCVRPAAESEASESFKNHVNASVGKRDFRLFRRIGKDGTDAGPIAINMDEVAFITPHGDVTKQDA